MRLHVEYHTLLSDWCLHPCPPEDVLVLVARAVLLLEVGSPNLVVPEPLCFEFHLNVAEDGSFHAGEEVLYFLDSLGFCVDKVLAGLHCYSSYYTYTVIVIVVPIG